MAVDLVKYAIVLDSEEKMGKFFMYYNENKNMTSWVE